MKTKAQISFAVTAKLICTFVFSNSDCLFSHEAAQLYLLIIEQLHEKTNKIVQLICAFVFATQLIVQYLYNFNLKFQAVTVQAGLCRTWWEPKLLVFSCTGSIVKE